MSFAAPLFLIAILAGAIPVVLHMISRQKAPVLPFSTLRFLQNSVQRTRRRKRIHDLVLLLLRMVALVLVAVALAKPTVRHLGGLLGRNSARAMVIILDNSASMATVDQTGSRWERATHVAEQLLNQLSNRDSAGLFVTCGPIVPETNRLYQNHEAIYQSLNACQVRHERADLTVQLQAARSLLRREEAPNKEIYVITDMQAVSWNVLDKQINGKNQSTDNNRNPPRQAGFRSTDFDSSEIIPIVLVDVHGPPLPNVALGEFEMNITAPIAGVPVEATVTVVGDRMADQQKHVELLLDGRKLAVSPTLSVGAGETKRHTFQFTPEQAGLLRGEFRLLGNDACPLDNQRFFSLVVDPHIPVAIVQTSDDDIAYLKDTYYLERALALRNQGTWAIHATLLNPRQLMSEQLSKFSVVICVNLPALDSTTMQKLHQYVMGGGHVLWTCGKNVDPAQYHAMNEEVGGQMLPAQMTEVLGQPAGRADPRHIGWLDNQYPALEPLMEPASLYQSVLVHQHMGMVAPKESDARVLIRLDDGEPLLVERAVGRGSVLLLATSVWVDWTNLPLRPLFLPLMTRLVFHLADSDAGSIQCYAGKPLQFPISADIDSAIEITRPASNNGIPSSFRFSAKDFSAHEQTSSGYQASGSDPSHAFFYSETHDVGIYEIKITSADRTRQLAFGVNLDPVELDASVLDLKQLEDRFQSRTLIFCNQPEDLLDSMTRLREGVSLWELFLIVVLVALVAEAYVANRRVSIEAAPQTSRTPADDWFRRFRKKPDTIHIPGG
ncbi:MAG: BatA and WFA domain-containing protein [Pirellulales bacterium]|nr:BatA and WFA domain-containing protein [Pirellulales bacterium]